MNAPSTNAVSVTSPLRIEGLVKSYGQRRALDGVSLDVRGGEIFGLLGPNGAGKTTTIRAVVGRVAPDSGSIAVFGEPVGAPKARAAIGYIPQEIALYGRLTALENLAVFAHYHGLAGPRIARASEECLQWAGLQDRAKEPVSAYSGGMKRRLNMAAGLLHEPRLVLLDEPTTGVDPQSRQRIYTMVEELRTRGVTVIYTTHYMEEAERLCNRIAIIDAGRIIALGTRDELVKKSFGTRCELAIHCEGEPGPEQTRWAEGRGGKRDGASLRFTVADPAAEVAEILQAARGAGVPIRDLALTAPNLESVFLHLTGRELRE